MEVGVIGEVRSARRCGAPLVSIDTGDAYGVARAVGVSCGAVPCVAWDCVSGLRGVNEAGANEAARVVPAADIPGVVPGRDFPEALEFCDGLRDGSVVLVMSAHLVLTSGNLPAVQAVCNRRDVWKSRGLCMILLAQSGAVLPAELAGDVLAFVDTLPDGAARKAIVSSVVDDAQAAKPGLLVTSAQLDGAGDALSGLGAFQCEQSAALALVSTGALDTSYLWARKREAIKAVRGLSMDALTGPTLADVGGLEYIKGLSDRLAESREPFAIVVRIEEIEKAIGAASTESSGTGRDQLFSLLDAMESRGWGGLIAVGPPGSGKSYYAETLARSFTRPSFKLDLGGLKASLVGESESNVRRALDTLFAIGGARVFFVATSNGLDAVPPELIRRFWHGVYFFDLATRAERESIWRVHLTRYGLPYEASGAAVAAVEARGVEWSSAEIRNVCRYAYLFSETLLSASARIAPYAVSGASKLLKLRQSAAGAWLSASTGALYSMPGAGAMAAAPGRVLSMGGA